MSARVSTAIPEKMDTNKVFQNMIGHNWKIMRN